MDIKKICHGIDLNSNVEKISSWLKSNGIQKGDRVAAYMPNIPETVVAYISTAVR